MKNKNRQYKKSLNSLLLKSIKIKRKIDDMFNVDGFNLCHQYSKHFKFVVKNIYKILKIKYPEINAAIFIYGSASREEMACESDADILIITKNKSKNNIKFAEEFLATIEKFNFSKIDILHYGSTMELSGLIESSIVEGNQLLESMPIIGDKTIISAFKKTQKNSCTLVRALRNLIFQYYCYDHYYKLRKKEGLINIKYSHGGTRDILFFIWLARIEALKLNKGGQLNSLSFINIKKESFFEKSKIVQFSFKDYSFFLRKLNQNRKIIIYYKERLIKRIFRKTMSEENHRLLEKIQSKTISMDIILKCLNSKNDLLKIAGIWELDKKGLSRKIDYLIPQIIKHSRNKWEILASLASMKKIKSNHIDAICDIVLKKKEFGYILRIIAQNPNTEIKTLQKISRRAKTKRYRELAEIALEKNKKATNFQI